MARLRAALHTYARRFRPALAPLALVLLTAILLGRDARPRATFGQAGAFFSFAGQVSLEDTDHQGQEVPAPLGTPIVALSARSSTDTTVCGVGHVSDTTGTVVVDIADIPACTVLAAQPGGCYRWIFIVHGQNFFTACGSDYWIALWQQTGQPRPLDVGQMAELIPAYLDPAADPAAGLQVGDQGAFVLPLATLTGVLSEGTADQIHRLQALRMPLPPAPAGTVITILARQESCNSGQGGPGCHPGTVVVCGTTMVQDDQGHYTFDLTVQNVCDPPEPEAVEYLLIVRDVVTGNTCVKGVSSTEPDDPAVLGLVLHIDGILLDQSGQQPAPKPTAGQPPSSGPSPTPSPAPQSSCTLPANPAAAIWLSGGPNPFHVTRATVSRDGSRVVVQGALDDSYSGNIQVQITVGQDSAAGRVSGTSTLHESEPWKGGSQHRTMTIEVRLSNSGAGVFKPGPATAHEEIAVVHPRGEVDDPDCFDVQLNIQQ